MYKIFSLIIVLFFSLESHSKEDFKNDLKNDVNIALTLLPESLDPIKAWNFQHLMLMQCYYQVLLRIDESGSLIGDLAEKWEISNKNKTYTFYLNKNAKFHNGESVTANDVAWSISSHFWNESESENGIYLEKILSVSKKLNKGEIHPSLVVINSHTIQFNLKNEYPPFLYVLCIPSFSIFKENKLNSTKFIGSGPFVPELDKNLSKLVMTSFDLYSNNKPEINKITAIKLRDKIEISELLSKKRIDIIIGATRGFVEDLELPSEYELIYMSNLTFTHIFFNLNKKLYGDKKLRKYLTFLIQDSFKKEPLSKFYNYNPHYFPKGVMQIHYYKEKNEMNYYSKLYIKSKMEITKELNILIIKNYFSDKMIKRVDELFADLGVKIKWNFVGANFISEINKGNYDLFVGGYSGNFPDPDGYLEPLRIGSIPSGKLLKELDKHRFTSDPIERLNKYSNSFKEFEDEYYFIPLFQTTVPIIKKKNVHIPEGKYGYETELWKILLEK